MDIGGTSFSSLYSGNAISGNFNSSQILNSEQSNSVVPTEPSNSSSNENRDKASGEENFSKNQSQSSKNQANTNQSAINLSESDLKQVQELKQRDMEVKNHEAAHLAAAGKYATGGASFEYKRGPDGKNYAVGGEVGIDTSPIPNDPQATIQKARQIKSAAQAPANPSSTDRQVAASAGQMEVQARQEITQQRVEKKTDENFASDENDQNTSESSNKPIDSSYNKKATSEYETVNNLPNQEDNINSLIELVA